MLSGCRQNKGNSKTEIWDRSEYSIHTLPIHWQCPKTAGSNAGTHAGGWRFHTHGCLPESRQGKYGSCQKWCAQTGRDATIHPIQDWMINCFNGGGGRSGKMEDQATPAIAASGQWTCPAVVRLVALPATISFESGNRKNGFFTFR